MERGKALFCLYEHIYFICIIYLVLLFDISFHKDMYGTLSKK